MSSSDERHRTVVIGIVVVALVTLLYSILIAQQILAWFGIAIPLVVLYLLWRFVRAVERIAASMEQ